MTLLALGLHMGAASMAAAPSHLSFLRSEGLGGSSSSSLTMSPLSASRPLAPPRALPSYPSIYCGRGDKKTARGKRFKHSYGNARPRNKKKGRGQPQAPMTPSQWDKSKFTIVDDDDDDDDPIPTGESDDEED